MPITYASADIRAWECPTCYYMLLSAYPFQPEPPEPAIILPLDACGVG
jgi:hypothetical protein